MEGLYRRKSGVRELLEKEEKGLLPGQDIFFLGEGKARDSSDCLWGMERVHKTDYLTAADRKIPDWLIKVTFLAKV